MKSMLAKLSLILFLSLGLGCTGGMQVSTKINQVISEKKIKTVVLKPEDGGVREFQTKDLVIQNQFIQAGNEYFNAGLINRMKVEGDKLILEF